MNINYQKIATFKNHKYWYGGKGQIATKTLADALQKQNPTVWTKSYYNKAIKDIDGKTRVSDCSHLVCYTYGISDIGSYQIKEKYKEWNGKPKNGMILWRKGHVAIYWNGKAVQMKGIDYDYQEIEISKDKYTKVLYDPNINYDGDLGWNKDSNGWWYRYKEGKGKETYYNSGIYIIDGKYYAFDSNGYMIETIEKIEITKDGNLEVKK